MRRNSITVNIINEQNKLGISAKKIKEFVRLILRKKGIKNLELNILITDAARMRVLNKKFLRNNYATDVLAFDEGAMRADIAVSADAAIRRCKEFQTTAIDELKLYLVHAILHILGYNDRNSADAAAMRKEEEALLSKLCGMTIS